MDQSKIQLYDNQPIRTAWDEENEEWYFAIVDVVAVLTDSPNPQTYWRVMKKRLKDEGNETVTNCNAFQGQGTCTCPNLKNQRFAYLFPHSVLSWEGLYRRSDNGQFRSFMY